MICEHCKKEFSDKVWEIHEPQCPEQGKTEVKETAADDQAVRDRAKALKIAGSHNKSIARLLREIDEIENKGV